MKLYRFNKLSKEIHRVCTLTKKCNAGSEYYFTPSNHWGHCGQFMMWIRIRFLGYDGCKHCFPEKHKR